MSESDTSAILAMLDKIYNAVVERHPTAAQAAKPGQEVATDYDLDGKFGDELIRRDPSVKYWGGESYAGKKMSQTTPDYLDAFARYKSACAWANEKEGNADKAKFIGYDRKSAARARGWAARLRAGWKPDPTAIVREKFGDVQTSVFSDDDSGVPF